MKQVRAIFVGCLAGMAACTAGGPGYLPRAGPVTLRFGPSLQAAWIEARAGVAAWPALAMVTPKPVDPVETNQAAASIEWPAATVVETKPPVGKVVATSLPTPPANPYAKGLVPPPEGGWWEILTNSSVTLFLTNGPAILATPLPRQAFTPPAEPPRSKATFSTGSPEP